MPDMVSVAPSQPLQHQFNPYTENGGTILAIAGADFSVIAGDTRQSEGYSIQTRYAPKVFKLCVPPRPPLFSSLTISNQDRQGCVGRQRFCRGREHVREESKTTSRGVPLPCLSKRPYLVYTV
jgi:hypothetical protein